MFLSVVTVAQIVLLESLSVTTAPYNVTACDGELGFVGGTYSVSGTKRFVLALLIVALIGNALMDAFAVGIVRGCAITLYEFKNVAVSWTIWAGSFLIASLCVLRLDASQVSFHQDLPPASVATLHQAGFDYAPAWAQTFQGVVTFDGIPVFVNCTCSACERLCKYVPGISQPLCWLALNTPLSSEALQHSLLVAPIASTVLSWLYIAYFPLLFAIWPMRLMWKQCTARAPAEQALPNGPVVLV